MRQIQAISNAQIVFMRIFPGGATQPNQFVNDGGNFRFRPPDKKSIIAFREIEKLASGKWRSIMSNGIKYIKAASYIFVIALSAVGFFGYGCATTQQEDLWADPSYHAAPLKKILVIAMRNDPLRRRMWEDAVLASFESARNDNTIAIASYQLFPDDIPDSQAVRMTAIENKFDGVLVIAKAQRDTVTNEIPGYLASEPVTNYSRRWNDYITHNEDVYHPGYTETETSVSVRIDLMVPQGDGKLIWSVTSQSIDPISADQFRNSVTDRAVSLLKKRHIVN
jgi:hypothetical protein